MRIVLIGRTIGTEGREEEERERGRRRWTDWRTDLYGTHSSVSKHTH